MDLPFFKRSSEMGQNAAPESHGSPAAVCESTVLYFQSVGPVKLHESVQVPPPGSSVLTRRQKFPPFHVLAFLLGTAEVEEATGAPADPERACSGAGLGWHSPGGGGEGCLTWHRDAWRMVHSPGELPSFPLGPDAGGCRPAIPVCCCANNMTVRTQDRDKQNTFCSRESRREGQSPSDIL